MIEHRLSEPGEEVGVAFLLHRSLGLLILFEREAALLGEHGGEISFRARRAGKSVILEDANGVAPSLLLDGFAEPAIRAAGRYCACVAGDAGFRILPRRISIEWVEPEERPHSAGSEALRPTSPDR